MAALSYRDVGTKPGASLHSRHSLCGRETCSCQLKDYPLGSTGGCDDRSRVLDNKRPVNDRVAESERGCYVAWHHWRTRQTPARRLKSFRGSGLFQSTVQVSA